VKGQSVEGQGTGLAAGPQVYFELGSARVWHLYRDCPHLHRRGMRGIIYARVSRGTEAPYCKRCTKRHEEERRE
jgi:hypothetical protein